VIDILALDLYMAKIISHEKVVYLTHSRLSTVLVVITSNTLSEAFINVHGICRF
jgi:hypothetical protein